MKAPAFVVIGHVVRDLMAKGSRLGGTSTFAAMQAQKLGLRVGVVTRVGADVSLAEAFPGVAVAGRPSGSTTSFENVYDETGRRQRVLARAEALTADDLPHEWHGASVVLLGPVCGELAPGLQRSFAHSLVGVSAQGWLRAIDTEGRVQRRVWKEAPFWSDCRILFVSEEDLDGRDDELPRWEQEVPIVVVTRDRRGARVRAEGRWRNIGVFPAEEVEATGAGDVFATAFLVRYHETEDAAESARFASAAAACCVEAPGSEGMADRGEIEARMEAHKEVRLR